VQVADAGSGLDVSTAQYRFSHNGGSTWVGDWLTATVSGLDGTTAPQVMTATNVLFNQDSDMRNVIQFRITDMAGLIGTSPLYTVQIDSTPPTNPADLTSPSHTPGVWTDGNTVRFYVSSHVDVPSVDARLHGTRGGVALPGSPLRPTVRKSDLPECFREVALQNAAAFANSRG
jgi:hypothetical protein